MGSSSITNLQQKNRVNLIKATAEYKQLDRSYLLFVVITPTADRSILQNRARMCLKEQK